MNISDGRGQGMKEVAEKNKQDVAEFFKDNPGSTKADCQRALKISYITVSKHVKALSE